MYLLVAQGLLVTLDISAIYMRPLLSCITRSFFPVACTLTKQVKIPSNGNPQITSCVCIQKLNKNNGNEVLEISYKIIFTYTRCLVLN